MIEQRNNQIYFLAHYTKDGAAVTGLTVTVTIYDPNGNALVTDVAASELGSGLYRYLLTSGLTVVGEYAGVFTTAGDVDQASIPAMWVIGRAGVENLNHSIEDTKDEVQINQGMIYSYGNAQATAAALATHDGKLDTVDSNVDSVLEDTAAIQPLVDVAVSTRAAAGTITVSAPVDSATNALTLTRGDDYLESEGRELSFSSADWPDLTSASAIVLSVRKRKASTGRGSTLWLTRAHKGASLVAGGGTQTVVFEPDASDTADLEPGTAAGIYDIQATLDSGSIVTLVTGSANVIEDQTRA